MFLIFAGILALALVFKIAGKTRSESSVAHVLDRMHNHQGHLPLSNWLVQFWGILICLLSGQSVGREGPAVHLGAGIASQLSIRLGLPNNCIYTLIGCGVAAAIAASFNTPLAGVIFVMEVILMQYITVSFIPIILASVMGATVSQAFFENSAVLDQDIKLTSLFELFYIAAIAIVFALLSAFYIKLNIATLRYQTIPITVRLTIAGILTAIFASVVPEIMGSSYAMVPASIHGDILIGTLVLIGLAKLTISPIVMGLGIPGGLIGPLLVVGACIGGALGIIANILSPGIETNTGLYVMLGMAGMMAATLNAPLAALIAVLELSQNPHIIFPAMLVIVVACVIMRYVFGLKGLFIEQLIYLRKNLDVAPATQTLRHTGVRAVMDKSVLETNQFLSLESALECIEKNQNWIVIRLTSNDLYGINTSELTQYLHKQGIFQNRRNNRNNDLDDEDSRIDLLSLPIKAHPLVPIKDTLSLLEARDTIRHSQLNTAFVYSDSETLKTPVEGIITIKTIEQYYQTGNSQNVMG